MNQVERTKIALEGKAADRVPIMDLNNQYAAVNEILGKRSFPIGRMLENPHLCSFLDFAARTPLAGPVIEFGMKGFALDQARSAVALGFDAAWIQHIAGISSIDTKGLVDAYGRSFLLAFDKRGIPLGPMYNGGNIKSEADWDAWDKWRTMKIPMKTYSAYSKICKELGDKLFIFGSFHGGLFELCWQSMGFERFVVAARKEKKFIRRQIRFLLDLFCMMLEAMAEAGVPGVILGDDLAYRSGPMLNPRLSKELYEEAYKRLTSTAHDLGMKIVLHSCGNTYDLLGWLADCGFDGVQGFEPTAGMELAKAKEMVGDRMCLVGNFDVTHMLVDATKEEVFEGVRALINAAGSGGGYILSATNSLSDVSVQRTRWMVAAAKEFGAYPDAD
ncbi:MAG: hypothetical protein CVT63_03670 [Candidatus Anoxymicrobium japonicum]|uniref:Uroporphyrinogen decarboxylase (URO-D) domain-containing protein n=1 Tax=Candidatus Anoxymicrobium japonicum TaxID=2013648 RepID=A0A2N3G6C5_9ACTN|nr:MAG: hypothetical protein CVT63_03670 [Candidatus Anoxymicrobium japonicum]